MMRFDDIYSNLSSLIATEGKYDSGKAVRTRYSDGEKAYTKSIEGVSFKITPEMGVPILKSKKMPVKTPLVELEWIWQEMSNDVNWLKERNVKIWNEWAMEDGTIGKAYGYQLKNKKREIVMDIGFTTWIESVNQVEYVLHQLKENPHSRRIMTTLWDVEDLDDMGLEPCVWSTHWTVHDGKLNLHVKQRSADFCLGLPFNVYQYHVLHAYVAKYVGLDIGDMHWNIDNLHVYDRHIDTLNSQMDRYNFHDFINTEFDEFGVGTNPDPVVELIIPEDFNMENFFANRLSEVKIKNYNPLDSFKYEIAI